MAAKRSAAESNAALAQKLVAAQAKADAAQARVSLVKAQIEVKGKAVQYDYGRDYSGPPKVKVVDRQKPSAAK